jgi:hypothetical protein
MQMMLIRWLEEFSYSCLSKDDPRCSVPRKCDNRVDRTMQRFRLGRSEVFGCRMSDSEATAHVRSVFSSIAMSEVKSESADLEIGSCMRERARANRHARDLNAAGGYTSPPPDSEATCTFGMEVDALPSAAKSSNKRKPEDNTR